LEEKTPGGNRINMGLRSRGRDADGCIDFKVFSLNKKAANYLNNSGAQVKVCLYLDLSVHRFKVILKWDSTLQGYVKYSGSAC
jgi:hypothetical protein